MLHINIDDKDYILKDFNEEILFFLKIKYFLFIINDIIQKCWIYFFKKKSDFFDILIFILQLLEESKHLILCHSKIELSRWDSQCQSSKTSEKQWNKMRIINFLHSILKWDI